MRAARDRTAEERLSRARGAIEAQGFDALFLASGNNLMFLSGYPAVELTLARPFYLLVPRRGAPTLLVHGGRRFEAERLSWVRDVRTYERLSVAPVAELRTILAEHGLVGKRIGAELGFEQRLGMPFAEFERLRQELSPTRFEDGADLLWELRLVKSAEDVDSTRRACRITTEAYAGAFAGARVGQPERDTMLRMTAEMLRLGGGTPWVAITSGRGNYDVVLGSGADRSLEEGDIVWMDAGCRVDGFWSDFSRGAVVGEPSPEQVEAQEAIAAITREGVEMVRPGRPLAEIAGHCRSRVRELGLPITSDIADLAGRVGHGVGLDVTEPPHVSEEDPTILRPGMVISVEPGVATEYGIFHIEENVLCTEDGYELLSTAPRDLVPIGGS